jgi:hypothetical protein
MDRIAWRALWPPLTVFALILAAAAADIVLPGPINLTQARATALGVLLTTALGVVLFLLQGWQARRMRRLDALRGGYRLVIAAAQTLRTLQLELKQFPEGRPYPGLVANVGDPDLMRHRPFERANSNEDEWRRLYLEGERELLLEVSSEDEVFVAWGVTRDAFWQWESAFRERADEHLLDGLAEDLRNKIKALTDLCRTRVQALS